AADSFLFCLTGHVLEAFAGQVEAGLAEFKEGAHVGGNRFMVSGLLRVAQIKFGRGGEIQRAFCEPRADVALADSVFKCDEAHERKSIVSRREARNSHHRGHRGRRGSQLPPPKVDGRKVELLPSQLITTRQFWLP